MSPSGNGGHGALTKVLCDSHVTINFVPYFGMQDLFWTPNHVPAVGHGHLPPLGDSPPSLSVYQTWDLVYGT